MRPLALLLALLVLAASAGCLGGDEATGDDGPDAGDAPTVETTPDASTPPTSGTTPPATATPEPTPQPTVPPATPVPPEPKSIYNATFDFASQGDATGQSPKTQTSAPAPDTHASLILNVTLTRSSTTPTMLPVSGTVNSPAVRILDPDGKEVLVVSAEGSVSETVPLVPGAWTIRYEGAGTLRAAVSLTAVA